MTTTHEMLARSSDAMARRFAVDAADGLKETVTLAIDHAETMLMWLEASGASTNQMTDLRNMLVDIVRDIQGAINRTLENTGETIDLHQVDLSELEAA